MALFAPDYWARAYFPPGYWPDGLPGLLSAAVRDRDVFRALKAALLATQAFDAVVYNQHAKGLSVGADRRAVAAFRRTSWAEDNHWDDAADTTIIRTVQFELTLAFREEDFELRADALELLEELACNAITGIAHAGACIRHMTMLRSGSDESTTRHPEQRSTLSGQFAYLVPGYNSRNVSP